MLQIRSCWVFVVSLDISTSFRMPEPIIKGTVLVASYFILKYLANCYIFSPLKWYYDENRVFPTEIILKRKQVFCMRRQILFTIFVQEIFKFLKYAN